MPRRLLRATVPLVAILPILLFASGSSVPVQGNTLTVTKKISKLRLHPRPLASEVVPLKEGDRLVRELQQGAWYRATFGTASGFIHSSDVTPREDVRLSGQGVRETYTTSDTAAARKGFNPEVERRYKTNSTVLTAAYAIVDRIQQQIPDEATIRTFVVNGRLHPEGQ